MKQRELEQDRTERLRGWIVYLLYKSRPNPLEASVLTRALDKVNFPLSRRRLSEELDYLRSVQIVRVFTAGERRELDEVEQSKLVQRYCCTESDEEMGAVLCARLSAHGIDFQQSVVEHDGIQRVY
jgi:hypothetical protein